MVFWLGKITHDGNRQIARSDGILNIFNRRLAGMIKKVNDTIFVAPGL